MRNFLRSYVDELGDRGLNPGLLAPGWGPRLCRLLAASLRMEGLWQTEQGSLGFLVNQVLGLVPMPLVCLEERGQCRQQPGTVKAHLRSVHKEQNTVGRESQS